MWMHKFVILLIVLFLLLGITFYALIDSRVLESDKVQNVVHVFDNEENKIEEEIEEEIEEIEDAEEVESTEETEASSDTEVSSN